MIAKSTDAATGLVYVLHDVLAVPTAPAQALPPLAAAFDAPLIGIAVRDKPERSCVYSRETENPRDGAPWQGKESLARPLGIHAQLVETDEGQSLLAPIPAAGDGVGGVLWLFDRTPRTWSEDEAAGLALAAQALARTAQPAGGPIAAANERLALSAHLTSRLSHDFGNVLTSILGFSELAVSQMPEGGLARQYLGEVLGVARGGAEWLKKLHFFCRRASSRPQPADVGKALAEAVSPANLPWRESVQLQLNLPADLPEVACDADSLREALAQLLNNAHQAIAGEGTVALEARLTELGPAECALLIGDGRPGRFVEIAVLDSGPGFDPSVLGRLSGELFFSTKPRHRGLGLLMVYGIARRAGGGFDFGKRPGGGAVVRLFLPVAGVNPPAGGAAA